MVLFSVITLVLFSVITISAELAQWSCFRLSNGPLFGYHTHLMDELALSHLTTNEQEAIRAYLARVREQFRDRLLSASLFGSKARGDADAESDIDLLLIFDTEDARLRSQIWAMASDVSLEHNLVLSVRVFAEARWAATRRMRLPLYRAVKAEGITLVDS